MTDDLKQLHAAPKTIYLQVDPEGVGPSEWDTLDGATWCAEQINDNDVCYVRSDRIEQLEAERDELKADAMRYRWLKIHGLQRAWISLGTDCDGENFVDFKCEFKVPEPLNLPYEDDEGLEWADKDFDSAIDAAIAKRGMP